MAPAQSAAVGTAPRWAMVLSGALAFVGLGISAYLTYTHFQPAALACSGNGVINCHKVTTSPESSVLGIPVAMLGLGYYLAALAAYSPWAWRSPKRWVHVGQIAFACAGIAFVLWLLAAELLLIHAICLWCSGVHVVTFVLFVTVLAAVPPMLQAGSSEDEDALVD